MAEGSIDPAGTPANPGAAPALPMQVLERKPCGCTIVMTVKGQQVKPCFADAIRLAKESAAHTRDLLGLVEKLYREREETIAAEKAIASKAAIDAAMRGT